MKDTHPSLLESIVSFLFARSARRLAQESAARHERVMQSLTHFRELAPPRQEREERRAAS